MIFKTLRLNEIITQVNKCPWRRDSRRKSKSKAQRPQLAVVAVQVRGDSGLDWWGW